MVLLVVGRSSTMRRVCDVDENGGAIFVLVLLSCLTQYSNMIPPNAQSAALPRLAASGTE